MTKTVSLHMLQKEFVPHQESLELKELGFNEPCFGWYQHSRLKKEYHPLNSGDQSHMRQEDCNAPTFSQAFRWFRDNFGLSGWVDESFTTNNRQGVIGVKSPKGLEYIQSLKKTMFFETHEEAELACLRKLIEIVKRETK